MEIGLSLGTNEGDRLAYLSDARQRIAGLPGVRVVAQSPVYETEPVGVKPEFQHLLFLNAVLILEGEMDVHEWFNRLREIETAMGRHRGLDRYAPRTVDIDVIYAGSQKIASGGLVIPHPHWAERRFVVQPLADVRPDLVLPGSKQSVAELLQELPQREQVVLFARDW